MNENQTDSTGSQDSDSAAQLEGLYLLKPADKQALQTAAADDGIATGDRIGAMIALWREEKDYRARVDQRAAATPEDRGVQSLRDMRAELDAMLSTMDGLAGQQHALNEWAARLPARWGGLPWATPEFRTALNGLAIAAGDGPQLTALRAILAGTIADIDTELANRDHGGQ